MAPVLHQVTSHEIQFYDVTDQLIDNLNTIQDSVEKFDQTLGELKISLKKMIGELEPSYLANSYQLYSESAGHDTAEYILDRRFALPEEQQAYVLARILPHSNWKFPGLILRPGLEPWTEKLVGLDPLYVIDESWALLEPTKAKFNSEYASRLRFYLVDEFRNQDQDQPLLKSLPDSQLSFCLAYNFFHYKPFELVKTYLKEIFEKLRPGGVVAFTFNNCDLPGAVELAERNFMCYTPGVLICQVAELIGFEVVEQKNLTAATTWLELCKPGELATLRGGQALAKIVAKV
jgi:SAM-dependent methyltransferase